MSSSERFHGTNANDAHTLSPYWGEHTARYIFSLPYIKEKKVLDIACGTGYGLGILKSQARYVGGVDIDIESARQALTECDEKAGVLLGDAANLPFQDESYDVVVSFETLEHIHERTKFLSEIKRILKPAGLLILSTPNAHFTKPVSGQPTNPFHVFEYTTEELKSELENYFTLKEFVGQTLDSSFKISPFQHEQKLLPKDFATQIKLSAYRAFNKIPVGLRENLSQAIWKKPFYPTGRDYNFTAETIRFAPVLVAVCQK